MGDYKLTEKLSRDFKGVWIPKSIWLAEDLSLTEKVFLVEIDSLDNQNGCFASNKHFSTFSGMSVSGCSRVISKLQAKGYIKISYVREGKEIKKRVIRVLRKINTPLLRNVNTPIAKVEEGYCENVKESNTKSSNTKSSIKTIDQVQKSNHDHVSSLQDNFNKLWSLYPTGRKQGRKKAFAAYQRAIKNGTTNKEIQDGIINYKKEIEIQKTPINYIKQGSTWFFNECWSDEYNFTPPVQKRNGREVVQKEALPDWANDQVEQEEQTAEQKQKKAELNKEIQRRLAEIKES